MSDRDLLRWAANACGFEYSQGIISGTPMLLIRTDKGFAKWSPLTDDGDALRLAVKLDLTVGKDLRSEHAGVIWLQGNEVRRVAESYGDDPYAATRIAIVRAAAEIGKAMK